MSSFSPRSLAFSAFRTGSLASLVFRPSSRSFSGAVAVVSFASPAAARKFARRWAIRLGVPVKVQAGGCLVTVPVSVPTRPAFFGRPVSCAGGLRGFVQSLAAVGVVRGC